MTTWKKSLTTTILLWLSLAVGYTQVTASIAMRARSERVTVTEAAAKKPKKSVKPTMQRQLEQIRGEMQQQRTDMQEQIQNLKQQLNESRQQITQTQLSVVAAAQAAERNEQTSRQALSSSDQTVASLQGAVSDLKGNTISLVAFKEDREKTKASIENPAALHYKGVTLIPGGFIAAETVWRQRQLQADIASPFNSIPFKDTPMAHLTEFRVSARSSRMNLMAQSQMGAAAVVAFFEFDLLGAGLTSNSNESNSYIPRVRHAWMQSTWKDGWGLAAGQMWTLAQSNRKGINSLVSNVYLPDMIEAQYVVGLNWLRQPSVRVVKSLSGRVWFAASAEGAQTTFSARNIPATFLIASPGTTNLTSTVNYSFDKAPDIIAKIAVEPGFGHYELDGVARFFRDRVYPGAPTTSTGVYNDSPLGGGIGAAASWNFAKKVDFSLNALLGNGVGRYGTSQLPDVTVRPDGTLALIHGGHGLGTLEYNPNPRLKIYAYGGDEYAGRRAFLNSKGLGVGYGSPLNDNTACETEAVPTSSTTPTPGKCNADTRSILQGVFGFWYRPYIGPMGRVQYGLQYSYTTRETWSGIGGAPKADENMIFTSMRYFLP